MEVCNICFKKNCGETHGNLIKDRVEIDDDILETIRKLNEKGYVTEYCCAGHVSEEDISPEIYIYFSAYARKEKNKILGESRVPIGQITTIPNGDWIMERHRTNVGDPYTIIRFSITKYRDRFITDNWEFFLKEVKKQRKLLYEWAEALPPNEPEEQSENEKAV
jgi:hypothetical protein